MNDLNKLYQLTHNLKILYVEDDLVLQKKTQQMLSNLFKNIDTVTNGLEAFQIYENHFRTNKKYYDIVITDIKMPIMDGVELSRKIFNLNKEQLIVVTSAYDESTYLIEFINMGIKRFIKKPFTLESIMNSFLSIVESSIGSVTKITINENYYWDKITKNLFMNKKILKLSHNEKMILETMLNNQSQIFSNDDLFYMVYSSSLSNEITDNTIKSAIKRLRQKLPNNLIKNIYGQGYQITL